MFLPKWYFLNLNVRISYKMLLDFSFFLHYLLKCIFYRKRESKGNLIFCYNGPKDPNFLQMKIIIIIIILVLLLNIFLCTIYFSSLIFFGWGVVIKQRENKKKTKIYCTWHRWITEWCGLFYKCKFLYLSGYYFYF